MDFVTVYRAFSPADAHLVRMRLEAAGLFVDVADELSSLSIEGYSMATGGIRVRVPEAEAAEALRLLRSDGEGDRDGGQ